MALIDNNFYVNFGDGATTGYYGVTKWSNHTAVAGEIIRQFTTPAVGSERCFVCIIGGATGATEPVSWTTTRGGRTVAGAATYQECTGVAALNGDASTATPNWTSVKNTSVSLGQVIQRNNGASFQICSVTGTSGNGSEPAFSDTAGTTTVDNGVTWTSLGAVGNFVKWGAPHARLANALATNWAQGGNKVFVADNHAETSTATITISSVGSVASPVYAICVDHAGSVPPVSADLKTTASISCASTSNSISFSTGALHCEGIIFNQGTSTGNSGINIGSTATYNKFKNCAIKLIGTGSAATVNVANGSRNSYVEFDNTPVTFANIAHTIVVTGVLKWRNTASAIAGTVPTSTLSFSANSKGLIECIGVDFSAAGAGKTVLDATAATTASTAEFSDCQFNASGTKASVPTDPTSVEIEFLRCSSSGINYQFSKSNYSGTLDDEETIVRTGGASNGTTGQSWKIATTANASYSLPFTSFPIAIWNDTISPTAVTATVEGIWGGGAVPNNDDIWLEVEYLGASGSPLASFADDCKANILAASGGHTASTVTWGGSTTKFKMAVSFTAQQKGLALIRVKAAKPSSTFYIDPKVTLS